MHFLYCYSLLLLLELFFRCSCNYSGKDDIPYEGHGVMPIQPALLGAPGSVLDKTTQLQTRQGPCTLEACSLPETLSQNKPLLTLQPTPTICLKHNYHLLNYKMTWRTSQYPFVDSWFSSNIFKLLIAHGADRSVGFVLCYLYWGQEEGSVPCKSQVHSPSLLLSHHPAGPLHTLTKIHGHMGSLFLSAHSSQNTKENLMWLVY